MCFALPALDEDIVVDNFAAFAASAPPACKPFVDYLDRWYMKRNSSFPPSIWANLSTIDTPATNNGMEAFHRTYNDLFPSPHPNIRIFLNKLDIAMCDATIKSNPLPRPRKIKVKDNYRGIHQQVREKILTVNAFLSHVSRQMLPPSACLRKRKQPLNNPSR